jgi:hypothetical protein
VSQEDTAQPEESDADDAAAPADAGAESPEDTLLEGDVPDADEGEPGDIPNPVVFVTQVPFAAYASSTSALSRHDTSLSRVPPGGDLWIRYPDGELRNLTQEAGLGQDGAQGASAIAVRDPAVAPSGELLVVSIAVGAATAQFQGVERQWQLYTVTGLGPAETPKFSLVGNQPDANNIEAVFVGEERIVFVSDAPVGGLAHLSPLYGQGGDTPMATGLFALDLAGGAATPLTVAAEGLTGPELFSDRLVFTRLDHLVRPAPDLDLAEWLDESAAAPSAAFDAGDFPEPSTASDPDVATLGTSVHHMLNANLWEVGLSGHTLRTLAGLGRHELGGSYTEASFPADPALEPLTLDNPVLTPPLVGEVALVDAARSTTGLWAVRCPLNGTESAGQLVHFALNAGAGPTQVTAVAHTAASASSAWESADPPPADHPGRFRNPLELQSGALIASHAWEPRANANDGTTETPAIRYDFRLVRVQGAAGAAEAASPLLTQRINKTVSWWSPDTLVTHDGPMWELWPTEVRPWTPPQSAVPALAAPEAAALAAAGVEETALRAWLAERNLALVSSRDTTKRDARDKQQPYNLSVSGGVESNTGEGAVYEVSHLQLFEGLRVWGHTSGGEPALGRVYKPVPLQSTEEWQQFDEDGPPGAVALGADGSFAAFVPAGRPLSWQLTGPGGAAVVRERYWLSLAPGEVRACAGCHDPAESTQLGGQAPQNSPAALTSLLSAWKLTQ